MHVHNKMYKYGSLTAVRGFTSSGCRSISDAEMQFGSGWFFSLTSLMINSITSAFF